MMSLESERQLDGAVEGDERVGPLTVLSHC